MKRTLRLALLAILLFAPTSAFALLCASDPVPAGTLLFPFLTGRYDESSTAADPVADRTAPHSVFSITNASSTPRIVHLVLSNDFGFPLLDWDLLLSGYQTVTYDFADVMEGRIKTTGLPPPTVEPPLPTGPIAGFRQGIPSLPKQGPIGSVPAATDSLFGLCTDPVYSEPPELAFDDHPNLVPEYLRVALFDGLRKSQWIAENGFYGNFPPEFVTPNWLLARETSESVWASLTADVVAACGGGGPAQGGAYFERYARPVEASYYGDDPATGYVVGLGNTLLGDWEIDGGGSFESGNAVAIEMDDQDVPNLVPPPRDLANGVSFYRYQGFGCAPGAYDGEPELCLDRYTGTGVGEDWVVGSPLFFGTWNQPFPTEDFREPLPSAFAFRWIESDERRTYLRVWKEAPETYPYLGFTYVSGATGYSYYAWDDEGRVLTAPSPCPVTCPEPGPETSVLPLSVQEVESKQLMLPRVTMTRGWLILAFMGSNTAFEEVPGGYDDPATGTYGAQAWVDVVYEDGDGHRTSVPARVLGNYLCTGRAIAAQPRNGRDRLDTSDALY